MGAGAGDGDLAEDPAPKAANACLLQRVGGGERDTQRTRDGFGRPGWSGSGCWGRPSACGRVTSPALHRARQRKRQDVHREQARQELDTARALRRPHWTLAPLTQTALAHRALSASQPVPARAPNPRGGRRPSLDTLPDVVKLGEQDTDGADHQRPRPSACTASQRDRHRPPKPLAADCPPIGTHREASQHGWHRSRLPGPSDHLLIGQAH